MLAAININKYPYFDVSEIIPDPDPVIRTFHNPEPVKTGDVLPDFSLEKDTLRWRQFFNGAEVHTPVLFHQFLNRPLVIGFYSYHWQQYGIDLLKQLNNLHKDIIEQQGNLLIISAEKDKRLEKIVWENNLSLSFYFDKDNYIAEKFRIYSEYDPIWNRFSGVDANVPLLATYVVSLAGKIEYAHIDPDFAKSFPSKEIISSVKKTGMLHSKIRNIGGNARY